MYIMESLLQKQFINGSYELVSLYRSSKSDLLFKTDNDGFDTNQLLLHMLCFCNMCLITFYYTNRLDVVFTIIYLFY